MRSSGGVVALIVVVLAAGAAFAGEIVHFTNGTSLPIKTHEVQDGMIHVDLGSNAVIAFPAAQVDRITRDGADVYLRDGGSPANVSVPSPGGQGNARSQFVVSSPPMTGAGDVPSSVRRRASGGGGDSLPYGWQARGGAADGEVGTMRPLPNHPNRAARRLSVTGNSRIWNETQMTGSSAALPMTKNGQMRVPGGGKADPSSKKGVEILRFLPSDKVMREAGAEGKSSSYTPPPIPPAGEAGDGGSSN